MNHYTAVGGASFSHDARGNLTGDGSRTFTYDLENRLLSVGGSATLTLTYDPLGRLRTSNEAALRSGCRSDGVVCAVRPFASDYSAM